MTVANIIAVDFRNDTLFAVERDDGIFVAVTPICAALGIDAQKQRNRITGDTILAEGVCQAVFPSAGGPQVTFCLRLDLLNGWLLSINDRHVRDEETRQRVLSYKRECYAVLFRHFYSRGINEREAELHPRPIRINEDEPVLTKRSLVTEARQTHGVQAARELWFKLGLPTTPAMYADPRQGDFFYTAIRRDQPAA